VRAQAKLEHFKAKLKEEETLSKTVHKVGPTISAPRVH
jgi:hypothetical protein